MNIVLAVLILSIIIIVHELGHFLLAKKNGIGVTEFSLGMGPRLVSKVIGDTRYSLKLLPIGGSCIMIGEDEIVEDDERSFNKKGVWARISVVAAGPIFNFIFAFLLALIVVGMLGYDPATVASVTKGSPADVAGLQPGDRITEINGYHVDLSKDAELYLYLNPLSEENLDISYVRDGEEYSTTVTPKFVDQYMLGFGYNGDENSAAISEVYKDYPLDLAGVKAGDIIVAINGTSIKTGSDISNYFNENPLSDTPVEITYLRGEEEVTVTATPLLASQGYTIGTNFFAGYEKANFFEIIKYSFIEVKFQIKQVMLSLGKLIGGQIGADQIAGPVGVVNAIGTMYDSAKTYGFRTVFLSLSSFAIMISANLGVMNLLPIPALDGGRLIFLFIEVIRGKRISQEKEGLVHAIGIVCLMILMVFVLFNDISKFF